MEWWLILTIVLSSVVALLLLAIPPALFFGGLIVKGMVRSSRARAEVKKAQAYVEKSNAATKRVGQSKGKDDEIPGLISVEKKEQPPLSVDFAILVKEIDEIRAKINGLTYVKDAKNALQKWFVDNAKIYHDDLNRSNDEKDDKYNKEVTLRCQRFLEFVGVAREHLKFPESSPCREAFNNFKVMPEENEVKNSDKKDLSRGDVDVRYQEELIEIQKMLKECAEELVKAEEQFEQGEEKRKELVYARENFNQDITGMTQTMRGENQEIKEEARLAKERTEKLEKESQEVKKESQEVKKESQEVKKRMAKTEKDMEEMKRMLFTFMGQKTGQVEGDGNDKKDEHKSNSGPGFFGKNE